MDKEAGTVYIVDDDADLRRSLQWLLESISLQVRPFASAQEFLDGYEDAGPAVMLLDVRMPGMSGLDLQSRLAEHEVFIPVIIITGHADVPMAVRALKSGAFDFIEKPCNDQVLTDRIQRALEVDRERRRRLGRTQSVASRLARLTDREQQVFEMVVAGKSNKAIAADLGLSAKTIEVHRAHVMQKLQADSLAHLVRIHCEASTPAMSTDPA
jgi:FixJ family two-component response regulator